MQGLGTNSGSAFVFRLGFSLGVKLRQWITGSGLQPALPLCCFQSRTGRTRRDARPFLSPRLRSVLYYGLDLEVFGFEHHPLGRHCRCWPSVFHSNSRVSGDNRIVVTTGLSSLGVRFIIFIGRFTTCGDLVIAEPKSVPRPDGFGPVLT